MIRRKEKKWERGNNNQLVSGHGLAVTVNVGGMCD